MSDRKQGVPLGGRVKIKPSAVAALPDGNFNPAVLARTFGVSTCSVKQWMYMTTPALPFIRTGIQSAKFPQGRPLLNRESVAAWLMATGRAAE